MNEKAEAILNALRTRSFYFADASDVLALSKRISKNHEDVAEAFPMRKTRVALIGTGNLRTLEQCLTPYLMSMGIDPEYYPEAYNGMAADLLASDSPFYDFGPELVFVFRQARDIRNYPPLRADRETVDALAVRHVQEQDALWQCYSRRCSAPLFVTNYAVPPAHILGHLEANVPYGADAFTRRINALESESCPENVFRIDLDSLAADYGKRAWFDDSAYYIGKFPFALDAAPTGALSLARLGAAALGRVKKCLVLDLDNTLWGGVIGDDGLNGIVLDPNDAVGEAYLGFQRTLRALRERGVILAVCSKNEEAAAKQVFEEHPYSVLKMEDFSAFVCNWNDKAANVRAIAEQLNLGLDSFVFFDDNPAERALISAQLPQVEVIDVPEDPALFTDALLRARPFEWLQLSGEDLNRTATYRAEGQREELKSRFGDYTEYLRSLEMHACVGEVGSAELPRFTQLLNKTNQFNFTARRYTETELASRLTDPASLLLYAKLSDRFSEYGIVSAAVLHREGSVLEIENWVMSCRVFSRGLESFMLNAIAARAAALGCDTLRGTWLPSGRNGMLSDFYEKNSFIKCDDLPDGGAVYEASTAGWKPLSAEIVPISE